MESQFSCLKCLDPIEPTCPTAARAVGPVASSGLVMGASAVMTHQCAFLWVCGMCYKPVGKPLLPQKARL